MKIISHRGCWNSPSEKNTYKAFCTSFDAGYGTELDVRDSNGTLVISHDIPSGDEMKFSDLLELMDGRNLLLAINIKADGLAPYILELLNKYSHTNYFTFDMSIPDLVFQYLTGINCYCGISDICPVPPLFPVYNGIWLDSFHSDWYSKTDLDSIIEKYKRVCIVSADLHQRNSTKQWNIIRSLDNFRSSDLVLCTDKPKEASNFFAI